MSMTMTSCFLTLFSSTNTSKPKLINTSYFSLLLPVGASTCNFTSIPHRRKNSNDYICPSRVKQLKYNVKNSMTPLDELRAKIASKQTSSLAKSTSVGSEEAVSFWSIQPVKGQHEDTDQCSADRSLQHKSSMKSLSSLGHSSSSKSVSFGSVNQYRELSGGSLWQDSTVPMASPVTVVNKRNFDRWGTGIEQSFESAFKKLKVGSVLIKEVSPPKQPKRVPSRVDALESPSRTPTRFESRTNSMAMPPKLPRRKLDDGMAEAE